MKDVTGTMSWLGHVPGRQREGLYGHGDIDFRILSLSVNYMILQGVDH